MLVAAALGVGGYLAGGRTGHDTHGRSAAGSPVVTAGSARRSSSSAAAPVRSHLRADVVFGNLEGTLTDRTDGKCGAKPSTAA